MKIEIQIGCDSWKDIFELKMFMEKDGSYGTVSSKPVNSHSPLSLCILPFSHIRQNIAETIESFLHKKLSHIIVQWIGSK